MSDESVLIPNSVALVRGAPHPAEARRLVEFLASDAVSEKLISASALEGKDRKSLLDWKSLLDELEPATEAMRGIFLR